jgi:hypothetical protein
MTVGYNSYNLIFKTWANWFFFDMAGFINMV